MNSTLLITSELTNQRARKALFTCVVYTNIEYDELIKSGESAGKSLGMEDNNG